MPVSAEHQFVAEEFDSVLSSYAKTKLFGVLEADRKKYDYACVLERDCNRSLVSQVLWSNSAGVHKDLMSLLHDRNAPIKVYFAKDTTKHRLKIAEVISSYRGDEALCSLLRGLKIIYLPSGFDADKQEQQMWMSNYISEIVCKDLLFATVFGRLIKSDVRVFANHNGPVGLKYAVLDEIIKNGLIHTPTFKSSIGYRSDGPTREIITMLSALGLVQRPDQTVFALPTIKGRMFMDLSKHLLYEKYNPDHILGDLGAIKDMLFKSSGLEGFDYQLEIVESAERCSTEYGRNLLEGMDFSEPKFYSNYDWKIFYDQLKDVPGFKKETFEDADCGFFIK
ncbi:hypothetical protein [Pseudomonas rossensis]|uniref:hypothetical protein n=1 Tax=Pseudomonas rossensis TaxID=2305471 RepID=UPI00326041E0